MGMHIVAIDTPEGLHAAAIGLRGVTATGLEVEKDEDGWYVRNTGQRLSDVPDFLPVILDPDVS